MPPRPSSSPTWYWPPRSRRSVRSSSSETISGAVGCTPANVRPQRGQPGAVSGMSWTPHREQVIMAGGWMAPPRRPGSDSCPLTYSLDEENSRASGRFDEGHAVAAWQLALERRPQSGRPGAVRDVVNATPGARDHGRTLPTKSAALSEFVGFGGCGKLTHGLQRLNLSHVRACQWYCTSRTLTLTGTLRVAPEAPVVLSVGEFVKVVPTGCTSTCRVSVLVASESFTVPFSPTDDPLEFPPTRISVVPSLLN